MKRMEKNNGFHVPDGYFDSLSDEIFSKMEADKMNYTEGEDFKVPSGYFDAFTDRVLTKVRMEESKVVPVIPLKKYYFIAASIAAVLVLLLTLQWSGGGLDTEGILANSDIEDYFEINGWEVSPYDLAEMFPESDMDFNDILDYQIDDENVIDYLSTNIQDIEELNLSDDD